MSLERNPRIQKIERISTEIPSGEIGEVNPVTEELLGHITFNQRLKEEFGRKIKFITDSVKSDEVSEKILDFEKKISEKYPDFDNYYLYHVLIGGTVNDMMKQDDFPDEEFSIANFIENL